MFTVSYQPAQASWEWVWHLLDFLDTQTSITRTRQAMRWSQWDRIMRSCDFAVLSIHLLPPDFGFAPVICFDQWCGTRWDIIRDLLVGLTSPLESEVAQSCPNPCDPVDCSPPGSSVHGIFQARVLEWGAIAFSLVVQPVSRVSALPHPLADTGMGCHFLLQRIFPTHGSNPGLPHCRQTL